MESFNRPGGEFIEIDLVQELKFDDGRWAAIESAGRLLLIAGDDERAETAALYEASAAVCDAGWRGMRVRAIGYGSKDPQTTDEDLVSLVDGEYVGIGRTSRGLSLVVRETEGQRDEMYFSLDRSKLIDFNVEVDSDDFVEGRAGFFMDVADEVEEQVSSEGFLDLSAAERQEFVAEVLDDYSEELDYYNRSSSITICCRDYVQNESMKIVGDRYITGSSIRFIMPELELASLPSYRQQNFYLFGSRPLVELRDDETGDKYWVELHDIYDVVVGDEQGSDLGILEAFSEDLRAAILRYEEEAESAYGETDILDIEEEANEELIDLLPDELIDRSVSIEGYVLRYNETSGGYDLSHEEWADVSFACVKLVDVGGEQRISLGFDGIDDSGESKLVYAIPSPDWLSRLYANEVDDYEAYDIIGTFSDIATRSRAMVESGDFANSTKEVQAMMLAEKVAEVDMELGVIDHFSRDARLQWRAKKALCLPLEMAVPITNFKDSIALAEADADDYVYIVSDAVDVDFPELLDGDAEGSVFSGARDFSISHGAPMIFAEDQDRGLLYLIHLDDIEAVMPLHEAHSEED